MKTLLKTGLLSSLALAAPLLAAKASSFRVLASGLGNSPEISAANGMTAYGTTQNGGTGLANGGTVFSVTSTGKVTTLHNFVPTTDGSIPNDMLAIDAGGNVYGTTQQGGKFGGGTIFALSPARKLTVLHAFDPNAGDGSGPLQGVVRSGTGTLYGTAAGGAISTNGSVFEVTPAGIYHTRYRFKSQGDGHCPFSGVAVDADDTVYGTVVGNGFGGDPNGAVWKLSTKNKLTPLYLFKDGADGEYPQQAPILDAAGNIYGTILTMAGAGYAGAVWKIDTSGTFTVFYKFTGKSDGFGPNGPLVANTDGNLYGTTGSGGGTAAKPGYGTLFRVTPAGVFTVLHTFRGGKDGANPTGPLAHDGAGAIYGGTAVGTVYKFKP